MPTGIVISCFDLTGRLITPWLMAGYECHIVDLQHPEGKTVEGHLTKWGMDVKEWEKQFFEENKDRLHQVCFLACFPPCTDLAVSGARWFKFKEEQNPGTRQRAMDLVHWSNNLGQRLGCPYFLENPVSVISSEWRKPDYTFQPWEFGGYDGGEKDGYKKRTCLWTGNGFTLPPKKPIPIDPIIANKIHLMPPSHRNGQTYDHKRQWVLLLPFLNILIQFKSDFFITKMIDL